MGALPATFFRRGRLTRGWWLTASPFILASVTLMGGLAGWLEPTVRLPGGWGSTMAVVAVALAAGATALMGYAAGSHRAPVSLWHQEEDTPEDLTTRGAYRRIRHPFYTAFLLLLTGCVVAFPHALTALAWVTGGIQLNRTARREERRLSRSRHGERYRAYLRETGRFVPPVRRGGAPRQSVPNSRIVVTVRSSPGSSRVEGN
jgi:protein-S-isoprenylcysteine O-methyltransferase Ste14